MKKLPLGLVDAGASSLGTFLAALAAARWLSLEELGAYEVVFSAWVLTTQLATQMSLVPVEARLVSDDRPGRDGYLLANLRLATPWTLLGGLLTLGVLWFIPGGPSSTGWTLVGTGAAAAVMWPLQEHSRRLLHLAGKHTAAAAVSVVRLAVVGAALALGRVLDLPPSLLPLGAIAVGDALSLLTAWGLTDRGGVRHRYVSADLVRSGRWLLVAAMATPAAAFMVNVMVTRLASAEDLGMAAAARVAAQPVLVLAVGLSAVLQPQAMEAAVRKDRVIARQLTHRLRVLLTVLVAAYLLVTILPAHMNPLAALIPRAFDLNGLVQLSIVAAAVNGAVFLQRSELTALDRARSLAGAETAAALWRSLLGATAGLIHAWTVPVGFLISGFVRIRSFGRLLDGPSKSVGASPS